MKPGKPTIKGIFVNSHVSAVRKIKGERGIQELEKKYGKPIRFKNSQNVPVREEVELLEAAMEILHDRPFPKDRLSFEAGRLHFRNFVTTPLAKFLFPLFRRRFKLLMMHSKNIAGHVFQGVRFSSEDLGPKAVRVAMENNDYPIDHFRGLFYEWMSYAGLSGTVDAEETAPGRFEYMMKWK